MQKEFNPALVPKYKLSSGSYMPALGLGTFGSDKYDADTVAEATYHAAKFGYRFLDCAAIYMNEDKIGAVLHRLFAEKVVDRKELFITSKVWNDRHREVEESCNKSLADLGLEYLDCYFVHWPFPNYHAAFCSGDSRNPESKPFSVDEFMDTWRQCESLVKKGKAKSIGMSNMTIPKLEAVLPLCDIKPVALEMELHPSFQQKDLFDYALKHDIRPIGFCPIGSPSRPARDKTPDDAVDTELPEIVEVAKNHAIHPALVCLKWAVQRGAAPIPFSVKPAQYQSNLQCITEDMLTDDEMKRIESADRHCRLVKGQVFLWPGSDNWEDLWDVDGKIAK